MNPRLSLLAATILLIAILAGCAAKIIRADGPFLRMGPADAPLAEIMMPDIDTCKYSLEMYYSISKLSQCTASSAKLPFAGSVRHDFQGITLPISARTMAACKDLVARTSKGAGWKVLEPCKQIGETISTAQSTPTATP